MRFLSRRTQAQRHDVGKIVDVPVCQRISGSIRMVFAIPVADRSEEHTSELQSP